MPGVDRPPAMKSGPCRHWMLCIAMAAGFARVLPAQQAVPPPPPANPRQAVHLDARDPLKSLASQLGEAVFEQREAFVTAFADADRSVDAKQAELRAQGLVASDEAKGNLDSARAAAAQAFHDLSFSTTDTWRTARHNALLAVRKILAALDDLEATASRPRA
jgi:hypothetical protein